MSLDSSAIGSVLIGFCSVGIAIFSYKLGFLDGRSAQQREDYQRWRERQIRWREFEDE